MNGVPTEEGATTGPSARRVRLRGYGVTKDTKEVPENYTNIYHGIYHGAFL